MLLYYLSLLDTPEDKQKLEKMYYEYRELMKHIALDILKDEVLAEDAVHDAFIKLIKYLDRLDDVYSERTESYIIKVVSSVAINSFNKEKKLRDLRTDEDFVLKADDKDILDNINVENLLQTIKSLPDIYRDVLELKIYQELSDKEIAHILNIKLSTAKKRLERARKYLKVILGEEE